VRPSRLAFASLLIAGPAAAAAPPFPADSAFLPLRCSDKQVMTDQTGDSAGNLDERDVVGVFDAPAALRAADDQFLYLRMRLDKDAAPTGQVKPSSWGMAFDLDGDRQTYELLVLADGIGGPTGVVSLFTNHTTTTRNDRTDPADQPAVTTFAFADSARTVQTTSNQGGSPDFFLDIGIPWTALRPLGLDRDTATYVWVASSTKSDRLDGDFACFDERTGTPTLEQTSSDHTTGDPTHDPGSGTGTGTGGGTGTGTGGGNPRLEGGGGCGAAGGASGSAALAIAAALVARRRRRGAPRA
jgi:uncharacterized protein (TIGR03382 family)